MFDLCFTITAGRSGSAWLAKFLSENLGIVAIHETLSIEDYGVHMPSIRQMRTFNTYGYTNEIAEFWDRKLASLPQGRPYAETNHTLAKCGMIEALARSGRSDNAVVVVLRRDLRKQCMSYVHRQDFINLTMLWQWYLAPHYNNIIVNPEPFMNAGISAIALWYTYEMECRQIYYRKRYSDRINFVDAQLEDLNTEAGARDFLLELGVDQQPALPPRVNDSKDKAHSQLYADITKMMEALKFDPETIVDNFIDLGKDLDLQKLAKAA